MLTSWSTPREALYNESACTKLSWHIGRCAVVVWVLRDMPRVFIGGGEFGDALAREADLIEVEALAERFGSAELRAAVVRMRSWAQ